MYSYLTESAEETIALGRRVGASAPAGSVICLSGDLGAGKTTFVKGVVEGSVGCGSEKVSSPTFTYLNIYEGESVIYHFDLYRIGDAEDFLEMGFDEYLSAGGISCIEWSERIADYLPPDAIMVTLAHCEEGKREIVVTGVAPQEE